MQGFGESPYVARMLSETFQTPECKLVSVNQPSKKAVAVGTALHYLQQNITARATRFEYGIVVGRCFIEFGHLAGSRKTFYDKDGRKRIRGGWAAIVGKASPLPGFYFPGLLIDPLTYHRTQFMKQVAG